MSVLEEVLFEEYDRSMKIVRAIEAEQETLPRGSLQEKTIRGRKYFYLQYRDGEKVRSDYIKPNEVDFVRQAIQKRKENDLHIKELNRSLAQIRKALGKDRIDEHSAEGIH